MPCDSNSADLKRNLTLGLALVLTILRTKRLRRQTLFYLTLAALVLVGAGGTLLDPFLSDHPWVFLVYWLLCGGLAVLLMLLAVYDILLVGRDLRTEERRLGREMLDKADAETPKEDDGFPMDRVNLALLRALEGAKRLPPRLLERICRD